MSQAVMGTRISASGQTTVPVSVRKALGADIGATLYWVVDECGGASVSAQPGVRGRFQAVAVREDAQAEMGIGASRAHGSAGAGALAAHGGAVDACSEWPSSFWATLGALDDPTFVIANELDDADDAPRLSFDVE